MANFCIFCGSIPDSKTKEHVIPKWLIDLTGDPNRRAFFGIIKNLDDGFERREYSFNQFTFPACEACNNKYASLEAAVKPVLKKILDDSEILADELSLYLDWLDKIRVGLWLGMNQLDKNYVGVNPNFHINTRIGLYDRILIVEKSNSHGPKLNFGGIDTPSFSFTPSAFTLIVNNYCFTNISYMFLLARRIGFPFPRKLYTLPDSQQVEGEFSKGMERIMRPLIRKQINENGTQIYQPMYPGGLIDADMGDYDSVYVRDHSLCKAKGIGNLFKEDGICVSEYGQGASINLTPSYIHDDQQLLIQSAINICVWQNWLAGLHPSLDRLTRDQKRNVKKLIRACVKVNNILIHHHERLLSQKKEKGRRKKRQIFG